MRSGERQRRLGVPVCAPSPCRPLRPGILAAWLLMIFVASVRQLRASILLMGPDSQVLTRRPSSKRVFSSSSELAAAMALIQTVVVGARRNGPCCSAVITRRASRHGGT